jgi:hypothetical protein
MYLTHNTYAKTVTNQKISSTTGDLRSFEQSFSSFYLDYGVIKIDSSSLDDAGYLSRCKEIIKALNDDYLPGEIALVSDDSSAIMKDGANKIGFICKTKYKVDGWNENYTLHIYTNNWKDSTGSTTIGGSATISSNGPDRVSSYDTYKTGDSGDDIAVMVEPRAQR